MKDLWQFLGFRCLDWREARLEDIAEFVVWLQLPAAGRAGEAAVLPSSVPEVGVTTVNRKLAAVSSFFAHQARNDLLTELSDVSAAQAGCASLRPVIGMSERSGSPGCRSLAASPIATETGHT